MPAHCIFCTVPSACSFPFCKIPPPQSHFVYTFRRGEPVCLPQTKMQKLPTPTSSQLHSLPTPHPGNSLHHHFTPTAREPVDTDLDKKQSQTSGVFRCLEFLSDKPACVASPLLPTEHLFKCRCLLSDPLPNCLAPH